MKIPHPDVRLIYRFLILIVENEKRKAKGTRRKGRNLTESVCTSDESFDTYRSPSK